jgi:3-hydroxyisobutyrate dehydrogenase
MGVVVVNAVTVPEQGREEFERRFAARAGQVSGAPGFEAFELLRPVAGDRYLVYTRWRAREDFEAWMASPRFAAGHRRHAESGPVSRESAVWDFEVLQSEYAGTQDESAPGGARGEGEVTATGHGPPETVAFIGVGTMGGIMSRRLLAAGHRVRAFDPSPAALERAVAHGAHGATSPRDAVTGAGVVVLSLPSPGVVEEVVTGSEGVLAAPAPPGVVIDMSTIDPVTTRRLHARAAEQRVAFLDAPVSGGVMGAESGRLTIMVGGDEAALDRCRPLLAVLGSNVIHVGPSGSGQVVKLCNNMLVGIIVSGLAETLVTGAKAGVDARTLAGILRISAGSSWILENHLPLTTFAGDYSPRFSLDLLYKDVSLFGEVADALGVPVPIAAGTEETLKAARARGFGGLDQTVVVRMYEELAGVRVLPDEPPPDPGG